MPVFTFQTAHGPQQIAIAELVVAGWTGRDADAVQHHIAELAALGVPAPSQVPLYYRVGAELLTQDPEICVLGAETSGEVEPFLVSDATGALWLGLVSDHTDRALETLSVAKSKQVCPKPVARELWRLDTVLPYLDDLTLHSEIVEDQAQGKTRYQSGTLGAIRPLTDLMKGLPGGRLAPGMAMLCGTLPAIGGIRRANAFSMALHDPKSGRTIAHDYKITELPLIS